MAFIPLPQGFRIAVEYTLNGQTVVNVYHVTSALPVITANLTTLADIFINWWTNNQRQNFTSSIALARVVVTDARVANGLQVVRTPVAPIPGTLVGATTPNNVAIVLTQRTGFSGRSFRGRTYFAGLSASDLADNILSPTAVTNLLADAASLQSQLSSSSFTWVVASFISNGAPRINGVATPINSFGMDSRVDTQRRRLPGTGE